MNEKEFKKGLEALKNVRMSDVEKARLLKNVLESPGAQVSPFSFSVFQLVNVRMVTALSLVMAVSFGGLLHASEDTLPGDRLYAIKVKVVEPFLDTWNSSLEGKIVWQAEKVERRIKEAEALAELESLDDERSEELERRVEQSSKAFNEAVRSKAKSKSPSPVPVEEEILKGELRERINNINSVVETLEVQPPKRASEAQRQRVENLKQRALQVLEEKD